MAHPGDPLFQPGPLSGGALDALDDDQAYGVELIVVVDDVSGALADPFDPARFGQSGGGDPLGAGVSGRSFKAPTRFMLALECLQVSDQLGAMSNGARRKSLSTLNA